MKCPNGIGRDSWVWDEAKIGLGCFPLEGWCHASVVWRLAGMSGSSRSRVIVVVVVVVVIVS